MSKGSDEPNVRLSYGEFELESLTGGVESESAIWRGMHLRMRGGEDLLYYALPVPCQRRFIRFEFGGCFIGKIPGAGSLREATFRASEP